MRGNLPVAVTFSPRVVVIVVLAAAAGAGAQVVGMPGAWLIGPMVVGIGASFAGLPPLRFPRAVTLGCQGIVGMLVAGGFDPAALPKIAANWPAVLLAVGGTLAASAAMGLLLARFSTVHRATTTLGTLPGGAQAMIALSMALGADVRAVATMQYVRIVLSVLSASLIGKIALAVNGAAPPASLAAAAGGSTTSPLLTYLLTAAIGGVGVVAGARLRIPAGQILGPLLLGTLARGLELVHPAWPPGVPEAAYVVLGLYVGVMFDRAAVRNIRGQLPAMVASIVGLIAICGCLGALLAFWTGANLVTGFLATTPGGLDTVTAIALTSGADVALMLSVQMVRLFAVVLVGPPLARWLLRDVAMPPG
jgi:membrane AbrB-like protein